MKNFKEYNKGDFIYKDWDEESINAMKEKIKELEAGGYTLEDTTCDFFHRCFNYVNKDGYKVVITLLFA